MRGLMHRVGCLMVGAGTLLAVPALLAADTTSTAAKDQASRPWMNASLSPAQRANLLIKEMTLDEKIVMMHGVSPIPVKGYVGYVPGNARLGIPALTLADGRAGVGNSARDITLLPAPIAAASSWDLSLINEYGRVLGQEPVSYTHQIGRAHV